MSVAPLTLRILKCRSLGSARDDIKFPREKPPLAAPRMEELSHRSLALRDRGSDCSRPGWASLDCDDRRA